MIALSEGVKYWVLLVVKVALKENLIQSRIYI